MATRRLRIVEGGVYENRRGELIGAMQQSDHVYYIGPLFSPLDFTGVTQHSQEPVYDEQGRAFMYDLGTGLYAFTPREYWLVREAEEVCVEPEPLPKKPKRQWAVSKKYRETGLRIREGGYYLTRGGRVAGPFAILDDPLHTHVGTKRWGWLDELGDECIHFDDGAYISSVDPDGMDLMLECLPFTQFIAGRVYHLRNGSKVGPINKVVGTNGTLWSGVIHDSGAIASFKANGTRLFGGVGVVAEALPLMPAQAGPRRRLHFDALPHLGGRH